MTPGLSKDIRCHVWSYIVYTCKSDIRPYIKWAVSLVIFTSIFLRGLCGYIWVNILTLSPQDFRRSYSISINSRTYARIYITEAFSFHFNLFNIQDRCRSRMNGGGFEADHNVPLMMQFIMSSTLSARQNYGNKCLSWTMNTQNLHTLAMMIQKQRTSPFYTIQTITTVKYLYPIMRWCRAKILNER